MVFRGINPSGDDLRGCAVETTKPQNPRLHTTTRVKPTPDGAALLGPDDLPTNRKMPRNIDELPPENRRQMQGVYSRKDEVLELIDDLGGTAKPEMIYNHEDTDISQSRCYSVLSKLDERGMVDRPADAFYSITESGEDRLTEIHERRSELEVTFDETDELDADPSEFEFAGEGGDDEC